MKENVYARMLSFLSKLDDAKISYSLERNREEAVMVLIAVPGQRWEIEFLENGDIEVERFISTGEIENAKALDELFEKFSD